MSGGHYEYFYFKMMEYAERIRDDAVTAETSEEVKELIWHFGYELEQMAAKMKTIEWYMSGDYSEDTLIQSLKGTQEV